MTGRRTVLLADADLPVRAGIGEALEAGGLQVCAEREDADGAAEAAAALEPDLALVDAGLPGGWLDAVRRMAAASPATKVVVIAREERAEDLLAAVGAGAVGFLGKELPPERLAPIVHGVLAGEAAMSRRTTMELLRALRSREASRRVAVAPGAQPLTDRELEALELLAQGLPTASVARRLGPSEVTVRRHVSKAVHKLGAGSREAAVEALRARSPR